MKISFLHGIDEPNLAFIAESFKSSEYIKVITEDDFKDLKDVAERIDSIKEILKRAQDQLSEAIEFEKNNHTGLRSTGKISMLKTAVAGCRKDIKELEEGQKPASAAIATRYILELKLCGGYVKITTVMGAVYYQELAQANNLYKRV